MSCSEFYIRRRTYGELYYQTFLCSLLFAFVIITFRLKEKAIKEGGAFSILFFYLYPHKLPITPMYVGRKYP
jgi:hypothetical protein